jgi:hypothetical protein
MVWKEVVVAYLGYYFFIFGGNEKNHGELNHNNRSSGKYLNPRPPE